MEGDTTQNINEVFNHVILNTNIFQRHILVYLTFSELTKARSLSHLFYNATSSLYFDRSVCRLKTHKLPSGCYNIDDTPMAKNFALNHYEWGKEIFVLNNIYKDFCEISLKVPIRISQLIYVLEENSIVLKKTVNGDDRYTVIRDVITSLTLTNTFSSHIPSNITKVIAKNVEDETFVNKIPSSVTDLTIYDENNVKDMDLSKLPSSIITLHVYFNQSLDYLTQSIKNLTLHSIFNLPIDLLPSSLTTLIFDKYSIFNQPIDHLPASLTKLVLGDRFNKPIDYLPKSVTHLTLEYDFNQPIDYLPPSLQTLVLGDSFNQPIDELPTTLRKLHIGYEFNQPIDHLPSTLQQLKLDSSFNQPIDHLPASLQILRLELSPFNHGVDNLPTSLRYLELGMYFNQPLDNLPSSLLSLKLCCLGLSYDLNNLPSSLRYLYVHSMCTVKMDRLPNSLKFINFGRYYNQPIDKIPPSVDHIVLGPRFTHFDTIPNTIKRLELNLYYYCRPNKNDRYYTTYSYYGKTIIDKIPSSVNHLIIGRYNITKRLLDECTNKGINVELTSDPMNGIEPGDDDYNDENEENDEDEDSDEDTDDEYNYY